MTTETVSEKPVKCIVLDAGPLIANEPAISSLLAHADELMVPRAVLAEVRDPAARARLEATVLPFLTPRDPAPASVAHVAGFARRTGDLPVLSAADVDVLALAYELECERNGGDWRLRNVPGQKTLNGASPPSVASSSSLKTDHATTTTTTTTIAEKEQQQQQQQQQQQLKEPSSSTAELREGDPEDEVATEESKEGEERRRKSTGQSDGITRSMESLAVDNKKETEAGQSEVVLDETDQEQSQREAQAEESSVKPEVPLKAETPSNNGDEDDANDTNNDSRDENDDDDDGDGEWITPSNLKAHQSLTSSTTGNNNNNTTDENKKKKQKKPPPTLQVATITGDFALQNVLLQMNLNLLSTRLERVKHARSHVLRCQACFGVERADLARQFCARCGQPALSRVACSVRAADGALVLHLARNYTPNRRGDRYSIPKPTGGSASGNQKKGGSSGGGKGGWGNSLILAEDQKEYTRAMADVKRTEAKKMRANAGGSRFDDDDFLSGLLGGGSGRRNGAARVLGAGGRPKVGAGRNVNSRKR